MPILAIDTSTEACSVALWLDGKIESSFQIAPQQHTHILLPMIDSLLLGQNLQVKDCDAIAFAEGPGSFTGLRIAAGVAQGLAMAHGLPLIAVSTLEALAVQAKKDFPENDLFAVALDARMQEVYFALYSVTHDKTSPIIADSLASVKDMQTILEPELHTKNFMGIFSGDRDALKIPVSIFQEQAYPTASAVVEIAAKRFAEHKFTELNKALPNYIRNDVAHKRKV